MRASQFDNGKLTQSVRCPWLRVNQAQTEAELEPLRESVRRGRPYGDVGRMGEATQRLGLESSLRPRGRPKKQAGEESSRFQGQDAQE
jgi:hypothetical protein